LCRTHTSPTPFPFLYFNLDDFLLIGNYGGLFDSGELAPSLPQLALIVSNGADAPSAYEPAPISQCFQGYFSDFVSLTS